MVALLMPTEDRMEPPTVVSALDMEEHWLVFAEDAQNTVSRSHLRVNYNQSMVAEDTAMFMVLLCGWVIGPLVVFSLTPGVIPLEAY